MEAEMFDAIGVSEGTRKPWTVAVSFIGQVAMVGLAILVPLIGTDSLPRRLAWVSVPEPPRALKHQTPPATAKQARMVPPQMTAKGLVLPARIPAKAAMIEDPDFTPSSSDVAGVPEGLVGSNGTDNSAIDGLLGARSPQPQPPMPVAKQPAQPAPPKRIQVGGRVQEGKLISGPRPIYPQLARQARIQGTVRLEAVISREGTILNLRAVGGHPLLVPAALAAVAQWVFRPTFLNDDPVEVATVIEVNFTLQQ
jgi:protein TonB